MPKGLLLALGWRATVVALSAPYRHGMEPHDSADDQPEDAARDEEVVQDDDVPVEDEQGRDGPDGHEEPEASDENPPTTDDAGDRPLKDAVSGLDFVSRDYLAGLRATIDKTLGPSLGALDALARQRASWAKTFVVPDFSALVPKIDVPRLDLPKLDLPKLDLPTLALPTFNFPVLNVATRQISESVLAGFDFGRFLPKIDFGDLLKFEPAGGWDKWWANWWPPNWPKDIELDAMQVILNDEGLPLVWVPRAEIVTEVLAAEGRDERVAVLVARRAEVADDCRAVLTEIAHPRLLPQRRLLAAAVKALDKGHDEAAQSLAVLVAETAVLQAAAAGHIDGVAKHSKLYERVKDAVRVDLDEAPAWLLRVAASLAPVAGFFTPFFPHKGDPVPAGMSRHVTVHFAFDEHYTEEHAVVAVLLMVSVVRGLQQGWEIWEQADGPDNDAAEAEGA